MGLGNRHPVITLTMASSPIMDDNIRFQEQHLVSHVHFGEGKCLEVGAGGPDGRGDGFHQQLLQVLAHKWPHLLQNLPEKVCISND